MILMFNTTGSNITIAAGSLFQSNTQYVLNNCAGSTISFYANSMSNTKAVRFSITETSFLNGLTVLPPNYGSILVSLTNLKCPLAIHFTRVNYTGYPNARHGAFLTVKATGDSTAQVIAILESITGQQNYYQLKDVPDSDAGVLEFNNIHQVIINGSADYPSIYFCNDISVVKAVDSFIALQGNVKFINNTARYGAAFHLEQTILYFSKNLNLTLNYNRALYLGGAIYITNSIDDEAQRCALQFESVCITVASTNNTAGNGGNLVYAYPIYNCYNSKKAVIRTTSYYIQHFTGGITCNYSLSQRSSTDFNKSHQIYIL